jgi:hypothetical protein
LIFWAVSLARSAARSSEIFRLSTMMRISRPACRAKALETPSNDAAISSSFSSLWM